MADRQRPGTPGAERTEEKNRPGFAPDIDDLIGVGEDEPLKMTITEQDPFRYPIMPG